MNEALLNTAMFVTYALLGLAAFAAIAGPLHQLITNFGKAKSALIGIVALAAVILLSYSLSSNEAYEAFNVGQTASKWISGGIRATMILIGMAVVAALYTEVSKFFR